MDKLQFWKRDNSLDENPFGSTNAQQSSMNNHNTDPFRDPINTSLDQQNKNSHDSFSQGKSQSEEDNPFNNPQSATEIMRKGTFSETHQQEQKHPHHDMMAKDMEILSSKLDAVRSSIDSMNQRLQNIERMAQNNEYKF